MKKALSLIISLLLIFGACFSVTGCGGEDGTPPANDGERPDDGTKPDDDQKDIMEIITYESASVTDGALTVTLSNGLSSTVSLPQNPENIAFTEASISQGRLIVYYNDGYYLTTGALPDYSVSVSQFNLTINGYKLIVEVDGESSELGQIFYPTMPAEPLTPSGACEYAATRDVTGRNTATVKITVRGYGDITLLLDATTAPITVNNFLSLAKSGFYDGLTFHRIISGFIIQGGDPAGNGTGGSDTPIKGEFESNGWTNDISHIRGVISMARSNDMDSASSQFFICNADAQSSLDGKYAAFGYVISGMNIVDEITKLTSPYADHYYSNSTINDKTKQAVIESVIVISDLSYE